MRADLPRRLRAAAPGEAPRPAACSMRACSPRSSSRPTTRSSASRSTESSRAGTRPPSACSATPPSRRWAATSRSSFRRIASRKRTRSSRASRPDGASSTSRPSGVRSDGQRILGLAHHLADQGRRRQRRRRVEDRRATSRAAAAQAEARARQKFVTLVENSTDFIGICDLDGVPFYVNPGGTRAGRPRRAWKQARRTHVRDFFFPEDQAADHGRVLPVRARQRVTARSTSGSATSGRGEARWMAYKVLKLTDTRRRDRGLRDGQPGHHRAAAARGQPAEARGGSVGGRPPQERVPGDACRTSCAIRSPRCATCWRS